MNYEEKYKQALERARDVYTYYCDDREQLRKIESIFPELRESEDERIRKEIIAFLRSKNGYMTPDEDWDFHNRWLAWLEKQGKQLNPDKVIAWMKTLYNLWPRATIDINELIDRFIKDFGI